MIHADIEEFGAAETFVENMLNRTSISREIAYEALLVFETAFNAMLAQGVNPTTPITVSAENRLGSIYLKIGYEGKRFTPPDEDGETSLESKLLEGFADKVSYSYTSGYNVIRISVRKSLQGYFLSCGAGILLAIAAYAIIYAHVGYDDQQSLLENYVFPFEQLYANAMLMVGPLVVFFSLLKNASDAVIVSERILSARKLHIKAIVTSAFAVLLALGLSLVLMLALSDWRGYDAKHASQGIEWSFAEAVVSMVPTSIFEPFESVSPIPLIVVAPLATYALISAGRDFDVLKGAIDACYGVFSRMLGAIMAALPVACFLAILDVLLRGGHKTLFNTAVLIIFIIASTLVLFAPYAVRLRARSIKVGPFFKLLLPLLRENHAIGSTIDAAPYNVRYCAKHYGMDRSKLSHMLPVLAQINRDGNCFLLMLIAMLYIFASGVEASPINIAVIAALVFFLSFGAPNQPGSILIGTLIIITYLNSMDAICMAIYLEVFLGVQSLVNVISDIVTVAVEEGVQFEQQTGSPNQVA